jgi:replicative DNA helicase
MNDDFRLMPVNVEAEMAVLGAVLVNNEAYHHVSPFLKPIHFSEAVHGRIFEKASLIIDAGRLANPVTLKSFFENDETLRDIGGVTYLARLAGAASNVIHAAAYGHVVFELAQRRVLIDVGTEIVNAAFDAGPNEKPSAMIETAEKLLYDVAEKSSYGKGGRTLTDALSDALGLAAAAYERGGGIGGLSTGLSDLDRDLGGLAASDLVIIAARPGMGKTALATDIAFSVSRTPGCGPVQFFSLEMSARQLAMRIIAGQTGVPANKIMRGEITPGQFSELVDAVQAVNDARFIIEDSGGINIAQLASRARRCKREHKTSLIVVDYIQLLSSTSEKARQGRVQEITEITVGLKSLAKELDIPVIALSQLSRNVENREEKRPQLSDLRDSGSIEQDADIVMFLYREEYYLAQKEPSKNTPEHMEWQLEIDAVRGHADIIIGKHRHGPTGVVPVHFDSQFTRFCNEANPARLPERFG